MIYQERDFYDGCMSFIDTPLFTEFLFDTMVIFYSSKEMGGYLCIVLGTTH